jgi:hypothetical protein
MTTQETQSEFGTELMTTQEVHSEFGTVFMTTQEPHSEFGTVFMTAQEPHSEFGMSLRLPHRQSVGVSGGACITQDTPCISLSQ